MGKINRYTQEELDFVKNNCKGVTNQELADKFNNKFETVVTASKIRHIKSLNGWKSGIDTKFKTQPNEPSPIGSTRIKLGRKFIKVAQPKEWIPYSHYIYEKEYGKIPNDHVLVYKNQDTSDDSLDNLMLVSKSDHIRMCFNKRYTDNVDLNEVNLLITKLERKVYSKSKKGVQKCKNTKNQQ